MNRSFFIRKPLQRLRNEKENRHSLSQTGIWMCIMYLYAIDYSLRWFIKRNAKKWGGGKCLALTSQRHQCVSWISKGGAVKKKKKKEKPPHMQTTIKGKLLHQTGRGSGSADIPYITKSRQTKLCRGIYPRHRGCQNNSAKVDLW